MVFPLEKNLQLRNYDSHRLHQQRATHDAPFYGVKGKTPLSRLLTLPMQAPYDVMHLVYLGAARKLLTMVVVKKLVNVTFLSSLISSIKVPHWFRRKPRTLQELCLWKSQEHKTFLLYYSPLCFFKLYERNRSYVVRQMLCLYLCLSASIYALSTESVSPQNIHFAKEIIYFFQICMRQMFGSGVATGTLHALCHLPTQVENFGSLSHTSATCFENVNRFLKKSVTGKKGQGLQIGERFLRMLTNVNKKVLRVSGPEALRFENSCDSFATLLEQFSIDATNCRFVSKVRVRDTVFHTFVYGKNLQCASYYAFLDTEQEFVKIKSIFIHENEVKCLCRSYRSKQALSKLADLPECIANAMNVINNHFVIEKGPLKVHLVNRFSHHAIIVKMSSDNFYGVRIINDYDHE